MQFVDGVSATESGLRTLPMVGGLLLTSMGSGVLVSRTGRYKIFPVVGTAVMTLGFVLLSLVESNGVMPSHIAKQLLLAMTPASYIGKAVELANRI